MNLRRTTAIMAAAVICVAPRAHGQESALSTIGEEPPVGAIVLFDGKDFEAWRPFSGGWINPEDTQKEIQWKLVDGGAMEVVSHHQGKLRRQWLMSRREFGDFRLHLEFMVPDSGNGNSGLFFGGMFELQILNSGEKKNPGKTDCGAVYLLRDPDCNAALPPLKWQAYDVDFRAPRFNRAGEKIEPARLRAKLNGTVIHDDVELAEPAKWAPYIREGPTAPIVLQDHENPVRFRNIWILESQKAE
jgi:hypothetical protein